MSSPVFAETMRLIERGTVQTPDIIIGIRAKIGDSCGPRLLLIDDLASEAKRIYLDSPDAEGDTDDMLRQANAALDVVIALCRVRVT